MISAVTLDFWGTLVDDRRGGAEARIRTLASVLPGLPIEDVRAAYRVSWSRFQDGAALGWGLPPAALLSVALDHLGASLRPVDHQAVLEAWECAHLTTPPRVLPGVHEVLRELRRKGLWVALISDTGATPGRGLRDFLAREGLRPLFDWLTFSNETGVTKRRPQAFATTLAALGVRSEDAVHVGDSPAADICGAQDAGMRAIMTIEMHDRRSSNCKPDGVIERIADLPAALDALD